MAHHKSAKKRIRRNARREDINGARVSRIRSYVKAVELAIAGGDKSSAQAALQAAQPELARGAIPCRANCRGSRLASKRSPESASPEHFRDVTLPSLPR